MPMSRRTVLLAMSATAAATVTSARAAIEAPLVVGHRGAPGYMPEHTIPGYEMAIRMGADFIEPDVVSTSDGHLIVRHEPLLSVTTDVASRPEFADRKQTRVLDGIPTTDFFTCDFTLDEILSLRARQAFPDRDHSHDGQYPVVRLQDVIDLAQAESKRVGRTIGVYPEVKHSTFHAALGLAIEDKLLDILARAGLTEKSSPVIIQSFEQANLKYLRGKTRVRLMQLLDGADTDPATGAVTFAPPSDRPYDWTAAGRGGTFGDLLTHDGIAEVATYADIIAPWKRHLIGFSNGKIVRHPEIPARAHELGLKVHTWTMRNDRLDPYYKDKAEQEYFDLFDLGVDGLFSDFADTAATARNAWMARSR